MDAPQTNLFSLATLGQAVLACNVLGSSRMVFSKTTYVLVNTNGQSPPECAFEARSVGIWAFTDLLTYVPLGPST